MCNFITCNLRKVSVLKMPMSFFVISLLTVVQPTTADAGDAVPPKIPNGPTIQGDAILGKDVTVTCTATGSPKPTYTWFKIRPQKTPDSQRIKVDQEKGTLEIKSLKMDDQGRYKCKAENSVGWAMSTYGLTVKAETPTSPAKRAPPTQPPTLTKVDKPIEPTGRRGPIVTGPVNMTVTVGDTAVMTCSVTGYHVIQTQWLKYYTINGRMLDNNGFPYVQLLPQDDYTTLTIRDVTKADEGRYSCVARNSQGMSQASGYITVLDAVPAPACNKTDVSPTSTPPCPDTFHDVSGICYHVTTKLTPHAQMTWADAREACLAKGNHADLASFSSDAEFRSLTRHFAFQLTNGVFWTGANYNVAMTSSTWIHNGRPVVQLTNELRGNRLNRKYACGAISGVGVGFIHGAQRCHAPYCRKRVASLFGYLCRVYY